MKEFLKQSWEEGTQIGRLNVIFGMLIGCAGHLGFYFLFKYFFNLYENFSIRFIAAILSLFLGFIYVKRDFYSKFLIGICWHFILIFILPFVFTVNLLKTNFNEIWLYWEIFMTFVLIMYIANWLMFLIDLFLGISAAALFYFLTSNLSFSALDFTSFNPILYLIVITFSCVTGLFFSHATKVSYLNVQKQQYNRMMKALAGSIVHEIRNPLNVINLIGVQLNRLSEKDSEVILEDLKNLTADISATVSDANNIIKIILNDLNCPSPQNRRHFDGDFLGDWFFN